jgi:hypothetical protein
MPKTGPPGIATYTPGMRRWVCILTLLAGFSADGYAYSARPRNTVPIERPLDEPRRAGARVARDDLSRTAAWWART